MSRRALVADPSVPVSGTVKRFLEGAGYTVKVVRYFDEAVHAVQEASVDVVFTSASDLFDGESLCLKLKQLAPVLPVVLVYPPEAEDPDAAAVRCGADAYLVAPLKRGTVVSTAKTVARVRALMETVEKLESDLKRHIAEPPSDPGQVVGTTADFEFFKKFLLMEVKRSRRYKYPVSFLLVGLDQLEGKLHPLPPEKRMAALAEALGIITRGVRDIDLAIPFSEGRYLVFLPHTPRGGAMVVATRARERLGKMETVPGMTASVGVAAFEPGPQDATISFGSLMKQATDSLRKAQLAGGDRVEAAESARPAKRDRISLG